MTHEETKKILARIRALYPSFTLLDDPMGAAVAVSEWQRALSKYTFAECASGLDVFSRGPSAYAPSVGQLISAVSDYNAREQLHPEIAWDRTLTAIRRGKSWQQFEAEHQQFPRVIQTVRHIGWSKLKTSEESQNDFLRRAFIKAYKSIHEQQRDEARALDTPDRNVRALVSSTAKQIGGVQ